MEKDYPDSITRTPQWQPIPGSNQVRNAEGGYTWHVSDLTYLERFLVLGIEGPSLYMSKQGRLNEVSGKLLKCLRERGKETLDLVYSVAARGACFRYSTVLFALAAAGAYGSPEAKQRAEEVFNDVVKTGSHLFEFLAYARRFRGWGRWLRRVVASWYKSRDIKELAYQMAKYKFRDGWSHKDVVYLTRPFEPGHSLWRWLLGKEAELPELLVAVERLKRASSPVEVVAILEATPSITWEMVPSRWLREVAVWEILAPRMPLFALVRNLGRLSSIGYITKGSSGEEVVSERLAAPGAMRGAKIHPLKLLVAGAVYRAGRSAQLCWTPSKKIKRALDAAFENSFSSVEPLGKRILVGLDVSGSMDDCKVYRSRGRRVIRISAREAAAALSLAMVKAEERCYIMGFSHRFMDLGITTADSYQSALRKTQQPFGGTDCALPMVWALENRIPIDVFQIYTDSETWFGRIHPSQALQEYRQKMGIPAKLIVVAMYPNAQTIADPNDPGMLDIIGFDPSIPEAIRAFAS